ncbi:hypothetical protein GIB67_034423, partial [Kingdonia uniflora]
GLSICFNLAEFFSLLELRALDMEKEMMDKSSPRGVLEDYIKDLESDFLRNIESETGSLNASTSETENQSNHSGTSHWRGFFNLWKTRSARRLASYPSVKASKCPSKSNRMCSAENMDICYLRSSWKNFKLSELQNATKNFSLENLIGKGGYAEVYKGCLKDGLTVAIKRLTRGTPEDMIGNFLSELGIMVHVNHPNIASLIGYGIEGGMHLVLQLSPNGSLDSLLHGMNRKLEWSIRFKIALGTAEGLLYLHDSCQRRIIHRDIKAANILLTENFEPQICDFGLAKWLPKDWTHHTVSKFEGTLGYLAPEYFMNGTVDEKTDIYAYGVLLLELITGLRPLDDSEKSLVMRAKHLLDLNDYKKLIDPSLCDAYDQEEMDRVALTANMCIQQSSILRPPMQQVVQMLRGDEESLARVRNYPKPFLRRTYSEELFDAEEYNSTRYLSDLQRHRQIAFDFR